MLCLVLTTTPDSKLTNLKSNCHKSQGEVIKIKSSFTLFVSTAVVMETLFLCVEVMKPLSPFRLSRTPRRPQASDSCSWLGAELKVGRPSQHQNSFHRVTARPPPHPQPPHPLPQHAYMHEIFIRLCLIYMGEGERSEGQRSAP